MNFVFNDNKKRKTVFLISVMFCLLCALLLNHLDSNCIILWIKEFGDAVINGQLREYVDIVHQIGFAINYSVILIAIMWIALLPSFVIMNLTGIFDIFYIGYKLLLIIVLLLCAYMFYKLLKRMSFNGNRVLYGVTALMVFPSVLIENISRGQVDIIALLFILIALNYYAEKKLHLMSLFFGISLLVKPFGIIIFGTIIALNFFQEKYKVLAFLCECFCFYGMDKLITKIVYPNYYTYVQELYKGNPNWFDWKARLFEIGGVPIYVILSGLLIIACLIMSYKNIRSQRMDYIMISCMSVLFVLMVTWNNNWLTYYLPIFIIVALQEMDTKVFTIVFFIVGMLCVGYIWTSSTYDTHLFVPFVTKELPNNFNEVVTTCTGKYGKILFATFRVLIGIVFIICNIIGIRNALGKEDMERIHKSEKMITVSLLYVPSLIYLLTSYLVLLL